MGRTIKDWHDAAADVYSYLNERKRTYRLANMLALIDDLCVRGSAVQSEMIAKHGPDDFIATTLGHVTTAIHGPGAVPKEGGWYRTTPNPYTYYISPAFTAAWKAKRRLD